MVKVALDGLVFEAGGKPAEIIAYGAAAALIVLGCAAAAGIVINSIKDAGGYCSN